MVTANLDITIYDQPDHACDLIFGRAKLVTTPVRGGSIELEQKSVVLQSLGFPERFRIDQVYSAPDASDDPLITVLFDDVFVGSSDEALQLASTLVSELALYCDPLDEAP